ncbi:MAG: archaeosortase/exosortase family protein [Puniceicoccales bacterium]
MNESIRQAAAVRLRRPEFLLFAIVGLGLLGWFYRTLPEGLRDADQIVNTAILLGLLGLYLIYDFRPQFAPPSQGSAGSFTWAGAGVVGAATSLFLPPGFIHLFLEFAAICCFFRAAGGVLLERSSRPLLNSLFIAFTLFGALLVSLPLLDMPLRIITGRWSAQIFSLLQNDTDLGFISQNGVPMLLLVVNGRPFHVAAECNGFGLLGTTILFTFAFIFYRKVPLLDAFLLVIAAVFLAVLGNLIRIFIIVSLAPLVGDHYLLMHEIVGTIAFYAFLGIQWWLISGFGKPPHPPKTEEAA